MVHGEIKLRAKIDTRKKLKEIDTKKKLKEMVNYDFL